MPILLVKHTLAAAGGQCEREGAIWTLADLMALDDDTEGLRTRQGAAALDSLACGAGIRDVQSTGRPDARDGRHFRHEAIVERDKRTTHRVETEI